MWVNNRYHPRVGRDRPRVVGAQYCIIFAVVYQGPASELVLTLESGKRQGCSGLLYTLLIKPCAWSTVMLCS